MSAQDLEQFSFESQLTNSENDVREKVGQEIWSGGNNPLHRADSTEASARFVDDKLLPDLEISGEEQGAAHEADSAAPEMDAFADDPGKRRRRRRQESDRDKRPEPGKPADNPSPKRTAAASSSDAPPAEPGAPETAAVSTAGPASAERADSRHEQLMQRLDAILARVNPEASARARDAQQDAVREPGLQRLAGADAPARPVEREQAQAAPADNGAAPEIQAAVLKTRH